MAKELASDAIMDKAKLKPLLTLSKREPVSAAVGVTQDGEGVILLDKKAKPKKVAALLRASASKANIQLNPSSIRYGRAIVDPDYDGSMVRLFVNKDAPGNLRAKLVEVVKRAAFQKVEINVDGSLEEEPEDEQQGQQVEAEQTAPQPPPSAPPPPPPPPPSAELTGLRKQLAAMVTLIKDVSGKDAKRGAELAKLANDANLALKAGDADKAESVMIKLQEGLEGGSGPTANGDEFRKSWKGAWGDWLDAMDAVDAQLGLLGDLMRGTGDPGLAEIANNRLISVFDGHKMRLNAAGLRLGHVSDENLTKAVTETRGVINTFAAYLGSSAKVAACEGSGLAKITIRATLAPALKKLTATLQQAPTQAPT